MAGALLRSGSLAEFHSLGAVGKPVFSAASQLRVAIRRHSDEATASIFATPKPNDQGDIIDWYAPHAGDVVPWSAATVEERIRAKNVLEKVKENLTALSAKVQEDSDNTERQVFGKLLALATNVPGDDHIYIVNGRPVLTFWGFKHLNSPNDYDVISKLNVAAAPALPVSSDGPDQDQEAVTEPAPVPLTTAPVLVARRRPWWLWLLPLLFLALLLIALLIGMKSCGVAVPLAPWLPSLPFGVDAPMPSIDVTGRVPVINPAGKAVVDPLGRTVWRDPDGKTFVLDDDGQPVLVDPDEVNSWYPSALDGDKPDGVDADSVEGEAPSEIDDSTSAAETPAEPEPEPAGPVDTTPGDDAPPPGAAETTTPDPSPAPPPTDTPPTDMSPPTDTSPTPADPSGPATPLTIPEDAVGSDDTSFLDGRWRSDTGLQDSTGNPIKLGYDFKGGKGSVSLQRSVGDKRSVCTGPASSAMKDGKLLITQGQIRCEDGSAFSAPRVVCSPAGAGGRAECQGVNEDGTTFPVDIAR
jgi:hypothetical protein